jgi:hypothetical protein
MWQLLGVEKIQNGCCHGNQGIKWPPNTKIKPFIHMPYNISIKFHPIQNTFFPFFVATTAISKPQNYVYTCQTKFLENFIQLGN